MTINSANLQHTIRSLYVVASSITDSELCNKILTIKVKKLFSYDNDLYVYSKTEQSLLILLFTYYTFHVLCLAYSWTADHFVGKLSVIGHPTRPTKRFILVEWINEY